MKLVVLAGYSDNPNVIPTREVECHIVGTDTFKGREEFEVFIIVVDNEWFALTQTVAMLPLRHYFENIRALDIAPFVRIRYVGDVMAGDFKHSQYKVKQVAWEFDQKRFKRRSELTPNSPVPFKDNG